jgi:single-strand DNA-binding protein
MEMFTGRVTANAKVNTLKDERQVVNFSIAINEYYKPKNSDEGKRAVTYINCAYWLSPKIAARITKGALLEVSGRLYVTAYLSGSEAKASLNCHVNNIKIHHSPITGTISPSKNSTNTSDDLPF